MSKHWKRFLLAAAIVIFLAAAAAWLLIPRSCFPSDQEIKTTHVTAFDDKGDPIRLAENTDLTALNAALTQLQKRSPASLMKAYPLNEVAYEINGLGDDNPFCVVLRKDGTGFIYYPGNTRYTLRYPLVDAAEWIALLDELTG